MPTAAEMRARHAAKRKPRRYAEGGQVPDWASGAAPDWAASDTSPDWAAPSTDATPLGAMGHLKAAITDIPSEIYEAGRGAVRSITDRFNPYSAANVEKMERLKNASFLGGVGEQAKGLVDTGSALMGVPALVAAPLTGAGRSVIGHALAAPGQIGYDEAKQQADLAMMGMAPARGGLSTLHGQVPIPSPPPQGPLGVTLSKGQETGELPLIQREQAAVRGTSGAPAQARAQQFFDQQKAQVEAARENVAKSLDPYGMRVAESPQEAGQFVSQGVQQAAQARKAAVDAAYRQARSLPGEIHAAAFEGMPQQIKGDLSLGVEPVIIDQGTPNASKMIDYLDQKIGNLTIPNKADPFGAPNPENILGVTLKGVEQWRKALSAFRRDAMANPSDARAARAVLNAFDDRIDAAVNNGLFTGDPRAIQAWNTARAAHADYKRTFSAGKNDPSGRVVEKIIGKGDNPAAIPNDVADFLYGSSGVNPSSLNVNVANRVRGILGDTSPEWSAVKQGLFSRLVETPQGVTDYGPGKVAQRLNRFINGDGKELAQTLYSQPERDLLQRYATLMRQLEVPQSGANWSNTATFAANALKRVGTGIGVVIASAIGHAVGLPWGVAEGTGYVLTKAASRAGEAVQARAVAKQLPLVTSAMRKYQKAVTAAQKANTPLSRQTMSIAATNLARSLEPLGIKLENLGTGFGTMNAPAEQNENQ